jgi:hypothetical protein
MKSKSADGQNESRKWPQLPKMAGENFQQSFAVAQLAVKLWEIKIAKLNLPPLEKQKLRDNPDLTQCLGEAWELVQKARELVLQPQSNAEYLVAHGGSHEAAENVVGRILSASRVPFKKLCNIKKNKGDTETIELPDPETGNPIVVKWRVYRGEGGERAFDNLFRAYWRDCGEQWKERKVAGYSETERARMQTLARDNDAWKKRGESVLDLWKRDGVPAGEFVALARFRRERDKRRAANLKKKPKRKRRLPAVKYRKH